MTKLDLAEEVLNKATEPLTCRQIWDRVETEGILEKVRIVSPTPRGTLNSDLGRDIKKSNSRFFVADNTSPRRFFLKCRKAELMQDAPKKDILFSSPPVADKAESMQDAPKKQAPKSDEKIESQSRPGFRERDLHPLLAYFVHRSPEFWGERKIYTKTIKHTASTRGSVKEELTYPDMVGVYFLFEDMEKQIIDLRQMVEPGASIRFFSFELKKELTATNCRKSFQQAVSNSSWANEGYLVAADISEGNDEFNRELEYLSSSFGIGIISLDRGDIDASKIMYPAKLRASLNWETIDKLYRLNESFRKFIDHVDGDIRSSKVHPEQYDPIQDPD